MKPKLLIDERRGAEHAHRPGMGVAETDEVRRGLIADLAAEEGLSDRYVSRLLRPAWLAPDVLDQLVMRREYCAISLCDVCFVASLPWEEQPAQVFD